MCHTTTTTTLDDACQARPFTPHMHSFSAMQCSQQLDHTKSSTTSQDKCKTHTHTEKGSGRAEETFINYRIHGVQLTGTNVWPQHPLLLLWSWVCMFGLRLANSSPFPRCWKHGWKEGNVISSDFRRGKQVGSEEKEEYERGWTWPEWPTIFTHSHCSVRTFIRIYWIN